MGCGVLVGVGARVGVAVGGAVGVGGTASDGRGVAVGGGGRAAFVVGVGCLGVAVALAKQSTQLLFRSPDSGWQMPS